jgi:predicted acyltransferase
MNHIIENMPPANRLRALDVFRGFTVALMIVVNCSGSDDVYSLLEHAPWHGLTFADLVFPAFLVVVGISAAFSHAIRRARGQTPGRIQRHVAARVLGLFALGLLTNFVLYPGSHGGLRWLGVLQRIALCALGTSAFLTLDAPALEPVAVVVLLVGYWLMLTRLAAPGHARGDLSVEGNFASWFDRRWMNGHMMTPLQDPEGLLSTLPAFATTLIGLIAGRRLLSARAEPRAAAALGAAGLALAAAGAAWSLSFPMNKHLWTSSYALTTGGLALAGLAACLLVCGEEPPRALASIEGLGRHALAAYVGSGFVYGVLEFVPMRLPGGAAGSLKLWLNAHLFETRLSPRNASLVFALAFTALSAWAAAAFDRRRPGLKS